MELLYMDSGHCWYQIQIITCLIEFYLKSTYFTFHGKHYEQIEGDAMGSPISPIVANLYIENFEVEEINTAPHPPHLWKRYVDDTFTIIRSSHRSEFLEHINSIDENIQFTSEDQREDELMPFLDILIIPNEDGSLSTTVYRKPTHTDLYLQWENVNVMSCNPVSSQIESIQLRSPPFNISMNNYKL